MRFLGGGIVECPACVVARGAAELDGAQHVGTQVLHCLERADRFVELHALLRVLDREFERALGGAHPVERRGDTEPVECARDHGLDRSSQVHSLARRARQNDPRLLARTVDGRGGLDLETPRREDAETPVVVERGHERDVRRCRVGDVHLPAVEPPPAVMVASRARRGLPPAVSGTILEDRDRADRRPAGQ